ncbi:TPA: helix-turn-helix transcriptional regulator [Escherichia coli]|nr:helix-turn-helix transcriptional regulator [Escherichia coli]HAX5205121.1 helix-turn-helix transcriptional regulator [Escherichia coli]
MREKEIVDSMIQYIESNLEQKKIKIDDLVEYTGFCRRYLQKAFKNHTGMTIIKYINKRRGSRAAVMLKLTDMPIIDISVKLFYDSQQTFTREFKLFSGISPGKYRAEKEWFPDKKFSTFISPRLCKLKKRILSEHLLRCNLTPPEKWRSKKLDRNLTGLFPHKGGITMFNRSLSTGRDRLHHTLKTKESLTEGYYVHFSFTFTSKEEYIDNMRHIYYIYAPELLFSSNGNNFDIEVIKRNNRTFRCHYFLRAYPPEKEKSLS